MTSLLTCSKVGLSLTSFDENLNHLLTEKTVLKDAVMVPEKVEEQEVMGRMGID